VLYLLRGVGCNHEAATTKKKPKTKRLKTKIYHEGHEEHEERLKKTKG
jgi:hypothetical protein